ncbi:unnamed protein product, partial [Ceratitis capitata]
MDNNREEPFYMENGINKSEESTKNDNNEEYDEKKITKKMKMEMKIVPNMKKSSITIENAEGRE